MVVNVLIEDYKEKFLKRLNEMTAEELTAIFEEVFGPELNKIEEDMKEDE